jgi:hypothetical protein
MTKPIPNDTLIDDLHPARFLKPFDLTERWKTESITVVISRLAYEETIPNPSDIDDVTRKEQPVLYFKTKTGAEFPRGMLISANENLSAIKAATGAKVAGELIGKRITIKIGEHRKKPVLRISPDTPPTPAPKPSEEKDVITAFSDLCKKAGIDQETRTAILRECGGDFETAIEKVKKQYEAILV